MEEDFVVIPRNIKVKEMVAYGLNGKQIIYLGISLCGTMALWSLGIPIDLKMAGSVICISAALFLSLAKAHGQELDRYIFNCIKYPFRQKEFGGESNAKEVTINVRYVLE
jgi:hypothetical protein